MRLLLLALLSISCRPETAPTDYKATIKPLAGPDKTIQTAMNTPVSFEYQAQAADKAVNPKLRIASNPKNGKLYSCQSTGLKLNCVYEPNTNFVGTDRVSISTVDGDFKADKNAVVTIIVNFENGGEITIPGDDFPDDFNDNITETNIKCDQAVQAGSLKTKITQVSFPAAIECEFNENGNRSEDLNAAGNGPRRNGRVRARREQFFEFQLEENAHICDIDFNFSTQTMQYDDEIFLLLNDYVLMSSTNYSDQSGEERYEEGLKTNSIGFQTYKWHGDNSLYDLYYAHEVTPKYCLGINPNNPQYDQLCNIPRTETQGQIRLDIPSSQIINLGLASQLNVGNPERPLFKFGFVSTGDNDEGDCEHSAYTFETVIKYTPKSN